MNRVRSLTLLGAAALLVLSALGCYHWYRTAQLEQIKASVLAEIDLVQELVLTGEYGYEELVDRVALHTGRRVTLLDRGGGLLADSARNQSTFPSFLYDKEILLARQGQTGESILVSPITGRNTLNMTRPGHGPQGQEMIIRVSWDLTAYDSGVRLVGRVLGAGVLAAALALALGAVLYRERMRPAPQTLARYLEALSTGRGLPQGEEEGGEELRNLARGINSLLTQSRKMVEATDRKYSHINTILGSMDSGLLAVDLRNEVVLFNARAQELAQLDNRVFFEEKDQELAGPVARQILEGTARVNATREGETAVLTVGEDLILEVQITPIINKYLPYDHLGALAMIQDITKVSKLETLRSEFVANVSHELRTPLTLISGFVETLTRRSALSEEETDRALEILGIESRRLSSLISQLLTLSHIENDLMPQDGGRVDLLAEADAAMAALDNLARRGDITVVTRLPEQLSPVAGNAAWMRQVVLNLCENAIKYTPPGGRVRVKAWEDDQGVWLSVKDNGQGIPPQDLPRIFERFYRVEKSRNSREGGSGLGLSIVEQMVTRMGGRIWAKSKEGRGSEFLAVFPPAPRPGAEQTQHKAAAGGGMEQL